MLSLLMFWWLVAVNAFSAIDPHSQTSILPPTPVCSGPNEIFIDGGPNCQSICSTLFTPCQTVHIARVRECFCMPTYARTWNGECIPIATLECIYQIRGYSY